MSDQELIPWSSTNNDDTEQNENLAEKISSECIYPMTGKIEYFVKWQGRTWEEATWVLKENLANAEEAIDAWEEKKKRSKPRILGGQGVKVEPKSVVDVLETAELLKKRVVEMAEQNQRKVQHLKEELRKKNENLELAIVAKEKIEEIVGKVARCLGQECGQEVDMDEIPDKVKLLLGKLKSKEEAIKNAKKALEDSSREGPSRKKK